MINQQNHQTCRLRGNTYAVNQVHISDHQQRNDLLKTVMSSSMTTGDINTTKPLKGMNE